MKGDYTRFTFNPRKHYSSVRMQQGRVQLDADWNEQASILAHRIKTEAIDVIGHCGAPKHDAAFGIVLAAPLLEELDKKDIERLRLDDVLLRRRRSGDFGLTKGRFYAGGQLCEVEEPFHYMDQPDYPNPEPLSDTSHYFVYLDVWQRHITADDDPLIRETALGGPDTATRTKTIWQIKTKKVDSPDCISRRKDWETIVRFSSGLLAARARPTAPDTPCDLAPSAGYRGLENQLYRVEIHREGGLGTATFKW